MGRKEKTQKGIDEHMRARKIASMINSVKQQNPKINKAKVKTQSGKKVMQTQE
jgi:hypothetical protein